MAAFDQLSRGSWEPSGSGGSWDGSGVVEADPGTLVAGEVWPIDDTYDPATWEHGSIGLPDDWPVAQDQGAGDGGIVGGADYADMMAGVPSMPRRKRNGCCGACAAGECEEPSVLGIQPHSIATEFLKQKLEAKGLKVACCGGCGNGGSCDVGGSHGDMNGSGIDPTNEVSDVTGITCCDGTSYSFFGPPPAYEDVCKCPDGTPQAYSAPCCPVEKPCEWILGPVASIISYIPDAPGLPGDVDLVANKEPANNLGEDPLSKLLTMELDSEGDFKGMSWIFLAICCKDGKIELRHAHNRSTAGITMGARGEKVGRHHVDPWGVKGGGDSEIKSKSTPKGKVSCYTAHAKRAYTPFVLFRLGATGLRLFTLGVYELNPFWHKIKYTLCCDCTYEIEFSGSSFPAHKGYINSKLVWEQDIKGREAAAWRTMVAEWGKSKLPPAGPSTKTFQGKVEGCEESYPDAK